MTDRSLTLGGRSCWVWVGIKLYPVLTGVPSIAAGSEISYPENRGLFICTTTNRGLERDVVGMVVLWTELSPETRMNFTKFLPKFLLACALTYVVTLGVLKFDKPKPMLTPERAATHIIRLYEVNPNTGKKEFTGACTATAVAPHVLLTALHCDEYGESSVIHIDASVSDYHVQFGVKDRVDHLLLVLDGPAFKNIVTIRERQAAMGEPVISYGCGGKDFPPHTYFGKVIPDANGGDQSDVDAADGTTVFTLPVIPGDSGSAIYGRDGSIVGLVTYGDEIDGENVAAGFPLRFSQATLEKIKTEGVTNGDSVNPQPPSDAGAGSSH